MPDSVQPHSAAAQVRGAVQRTSSLERRNPTGTFYRLEPLRFTYAGALEVNVESAPEYVDTPTIITQVRVSTTVVAGGDIVLMVRVNATDIVAFTLPASTLTVVVACHIVVFPGDALTVKVTTADGADVAVSMRRQAK